MAYLAGPDLVVEFANEAYRRLVGGRDVVGLPAHQALARIAQLYQIEEACKDLSAEGQCMIRQRDAVPLLSARRVVG